MPADSTPPSERMAAAFEKLAVSAKNINDVSNKIGKQVSAVEVGLQRLNIGVACWTTVNRGSDGQEFWSQELGYARLSNEWRIAIRESEGPEHSPENAIAEIWPFNEAPRYLRIKAIEKLPDLVEALVEATDATAKRLAEKIGPAEELATAVTAIAFAKPKSRS